MCVLPGYSIQEGALSWKARSPIFDDWLCCQVALGMIGEGAQKNDLLSSMYSFFFGPAVLPNRDGFLYNL